MLECLTTNLSTSGIRYEMLEGREYVVAPMVMITEGVHAGSNGPLYYSANELSKAPMAWDHKPIVVYHPEINGKGVTACDPVIMNTQKVGLILNTRWDDVAKKLRAEAWLEKARLSVVDNRIETFLEERKLMEVSTGLFTSNESKEGEWNGKKYTAEAHDLTPDHLALLPDRKGACSIEDGAGLLQLNQASNEYKKSVQEYLTAKGVAPEFLSRAGLIVNELSHDKVRARLHSKLAETKDKDASVWIEDVYDSFFIYYYGGDLFKQKYLVADDEVSFVEDPVEVMRVTEYRTVDGTFVGNAAGTTPSSEDISMTKKEKIDHLIKNGWKEDDRTFLMELSDERLERLFAPVTINAGPVEEEDEDEDSGEATGNEKLGRKKKKMSTYQQQTAVSAPPMTEEQYILNAPAGVREMLQDGILARNAERDRLVAVITGNANNVFPEDNLKARPLAELRALAALAGNATEQIAVAPPPVYLGAWPTMNSMASPITESPLGLPVMTFNDDEKEKTAA